MSDNLETKIEDAAATAIAKAKDAVEHPYTPLKNAMREAGFAVSEGEGFLLHEFTVVKDFLHVSGLIGVVGDEWHRFAELTKGYVHKAAEKVEAVTHTLVTTLEQEIAPPVSAPAPAPAPTPAPAADQMSFDGKPVDTTVTVADEQTSTPDESSEAETEVKDVAEADQKADAPTEVKDEPKVDAPAQTDSKE